MYNNFHTFICNNYMKSIIKIVFYVQTCFLVGGILRFKAMFHSDEYGTYFQHDSTFSAHHDGPKHDFQYCGFLWALFTREKKITEWKYEETETD
jgi:hypothetical protein